MTNRKGGLSLQLAVCSAGSSITCLPDDLLRQERGRRDFTGRLGSHKPDRVGALSGTFC